MDSFWRFFTEHLRSLPETLGTGADIVANEVPNPKRRRFTFEREGTPEQQMQKAWQQLISLYEDLGDVANLDDLQGFQELEPGPEHLASCNAPGSLELPSHGPHEPGRACLPPNTEKRPELLTGVETDSSVHAGQTAAADAVQDEGLGNQHYDS